LFLRPTYSLILQLLCLSVLRNKTTLALLDSGASTCFLDEEFTKRHKIRLVQKSKPIYVEVIDGRPLLYSSVIHESKPIEVTFKDHSSYVVFNIIRTPSSHVKSIFKNTTLNMIYSVTNTNCKLMCIVINSNDLTLNLVPNDLQCG
jgi:hypothetical protein